MPYDSIADLPSSVKKLPEKKQRQWMHVFNSCMKDGKSESTCFAMANGIARKEMESFDDSDLSVGGLTDEEIETAEKSYQYVDSYEYESRKMSQTEAGYSPVGGNDKQACSNCMFFVSPARCTIVAGEIAPNGLSKYHQAIKPHTPEPIPVTIVDKQVSVRAGAFADSEESVFKQAARVLSNMLGVKPKPARTDGFLVTKQADGRLRWFARYSNSWEDRDKEIITEAAHKEYVEWVNNTKSYPELWLWHTDGTRFGVADWVDFADGFAHASGLIDEGHEELLEFLSGKEVGVSHGFLSAQEGKYITRYRTFEISVLPQDRAAVWTTDFNVLGKETMMGFTPEKRKWLVDAIGEDAVKTIEQKTAQTSENMKELGIEYKQTDQEAQQVQQNETNATKAAINALAGHVAELTGVVQTITGAMVEMKKSVTQVQKSDDEKMEDAFLAKVAKAFGQNGGVVRPTQSNDNVLDEDEATTKQKEKQTDFFTDMMLKQFGAVGTPEASGSNGGVGTAAVGAVTVE